MERICDVCVSRTPHRHFFTAEVEGRRVEILSYHREEGESQFGGGRCVVRFQDTGRLETVERWKVVPNKFAA
jgi:hypothetical protein